MRIPRKAPTSKIAEGSKPTDLSKAKLSVTVLFDDICWSSYSSRPKDEDEDEYEDEHGDEDQDEDGDEDQSGDED